MNIYKKPQINIKQNARFWYCISVIIYEIKQINIVYKWNYIENILNSISVKGSQPPKNNSTSVIEKKNKWKYSPR